MHRVRCIAVSAEGGFKINGPPKNGKGPMSSKEDQELSNKASLPQPTQAGRIETCTELIRQAKKCLENNDKQCTMRKIEYLIKNQCHDGRVFGRGVADKIKDVVHELWLASSGDNEFRCELLRMFRDLDISKGWVRDALHRSNKALNTWLVRCSIDGESRTVRNSVVKEIEDLLRERFGWNEIRMCEELWRFVGVDVEAFRKYGVEPCIWLNGLETLNDLKNPYWLGLRVSDLAVRRRSRAIELIISTTNSIDAVFFAKILSMVKTPSIKIEWKAAPGMKHVSKSIGLSFYIALGVNEWPWLIKLNANELKEIIENFGDKELAEFIAGEIDGDGSVWYEGTAYVEISTCKACPKRIIDVLKEVIAERFGIVGTYKTEDVLTFKGKNAVRLLRLITRYIHHPLRRLRAELILALYDGRISPEEFERLYEPTKYKRGKPDIKRNHALEALTRAAPQTHTHGG
jgi:hypothetical protein